MWTQPVSDEQKRYYSKHSPKRQVYGWIMSLLQTAHGFLAFAAWTSVYFWVFQSAPQFLWLAPVLSVTTLFALHILFRTSWDTFWYDRLDDDPETDSSIFIPLTIIALLFFAEFNGAKLYLEKQVKPIQQVDAATIETGHANEMASLEKSYSNDKAEIIAIYAAKEKAAVVAIDRHIRNASRKGEPTGSLYAQRASIIAPIQATKASSLEKAFAKLDEAKTASTGRKSNLVAQVDNQNSNEVNRHTTELGNVSTYAWILSACLLSLIAMLGYARVRINVKSGILPLRTYTVLDAHGSFIERFATAFGDALNRRALQLAVWFHRMLSPKKALTSFDGTVVAQPGQYNTPEGFFPQPTLPQAADEEALLRSKVFQKVLKEATNGGITVTKEMLEKELAAAKTQNGTYLSRPLGKTEPSIQPSAKGEGSPIAPADPIPSNDRALKMWRQRVLDQVKAYDACIIGGDPVQAKAHNDYLFNSLQPISKEAMRLEIQYGVLPNEPEVMVWRRDYPNHKIPLSQLSESALRSPINGDDEESAGEPEELFKQNPNLFKQQILPQMDSDGKVIGIKYQKKGGEWSAMSYAAVVATWKIYKDRATKKPSIATKQGLEKWDYAMQLFDEGRAELRENLVAIEHS